MHLTTDRLILREFTADDWPAVWAYQQNPLYLRYYAWEDRPPEDVRRFVQTFIAQQAESPRLRYQLAITLKENGQLIGNCGLRQKTARAPEAGLGYELDPRFWGRGCATEAARAMVRFGFTRLNLHRISARCIADNRNSIRVLEKLGMQREGHLRETDYFKDRWWDTLVYAILAHEWPPR